MDISLNEFNAWRTNKITNKLLNMLVKDRKDWEDILMNINKGGDELTIKYHESRGITYALNIIIDAINTPEWCLEDEKNDIN